MLCCDQFVFPSGMVVNTSHYTLFYEWFDLLRCVLTILFNFQHTLYLVSQGKDKFQMSEQKSIEIFLIRSLSIIFHTFLGNLRRKNIQSVKLLICDGYVNIFPIFLTKVFFSYNILARIKYHFSRKKIFDNIYNFYPSFFHKKNELIDCHLLIPIYLFLRQWHEMEHKLTP